MWIASKIDHYVPMTTTSRATLCWYPHVNPVPPTTNPLSSPHPHSLFPVLLTNRTKNIAEAEGRMRVIVLFQYAKERKCKESGLSVHLLKFLDTVLLR